MTNIGFSAQTAVQQSRHRIAAAALALAVSACATAPSTAPAPQRPATPQSQTTPPPGPPPVLGPQGVTPPFMAERRIVRVGVLLPFASRPEDARSLYQAAELGVFDFGDQNTLLIPRESGATAAEAETAARLLLRDGVNVILGPVQREAVAGAARAARERNVPVIGFSSDSTVAGQGVYMLSLPLEEDVRRIVDFSAQKGLKHIALLAPENDYGRRVEAALRAETATRGGSVPLTRFYARSEQNAAEAARTLARSLRGTPTQAILIADNGAVLRAMGPALLIGGVNLERIKILGTGVWAGSDAMREPTLAGAWYAAPDPTGRTAFEARYRTAYGRPPSRTASLGYDAVRIAAQLSAGAGPQGISPARIERNEGFEGADGPLRFNSTGGIERGLAVLEVRQTGVVPIDPAPKTFRTN